LAALIDFDGTLSILVSAEILAAMRGWGPSEERIFINYKFKKFSRQRRARGIVVDGGVFCFFEFAGRPGKEKKTP